MTDAEQGFEKPNYTEVPNAFFDMLPTMKESELKVMLFAIRNTFGWHKSADEISLTQFQDGTGMSRQGVLNGIEQAKKRGILRELPNDDGKRGIKLYKVIIKDVDQSTSLTSLQSGLVTSQQDRPELVLTGQPSRHTKEKESKKEEKKKQTPLASDPLHRQKTDLIKAWWDALPEINRPLRPTPPKVYQAKAFLEDAEIGIRRGITPEKLTAYVKAVTYQGQYWHTRVLRFSTAIENAPGWCATNYRPLVQLQPAPEIVSEDELDPRIAAAFGDMVKAMSA